MNQQSELRRDAADSLGIGITSSWLRWFQAMKPHGKASTKWRGTKSWTTFSSKIMINHFILSYSFWVQILSNQKRISDGDIKEFILYSKFPWFPVVLLSIWSPVFLSQCSEALNAWSVSVSVVGFLHLSVQCFVMWVSVPISGWPWSRFCLLMAFWWYLQSRSCSLGKSDVSLASYWVLSSVKPKYL